MASVIKVLRFYFYSCVLSNGVLSNRETSARDITCDSSYKGETLKCNDWEIRLYKIAPNKFLPGFGLRLEFG